MLQVEKLSVAYGETLILRDVDFEVGRGEVVCLMGRNGVGKTTLLKSIMGLLPPRSGHIYLEARDAPPAAAPRKPDPQSNGRGFVPDEPAAARPAARSATLQSVLNLLRRRAGFGPRGQDLTRAAPDARARAGIGYVPQGREIFPHLTVLENLQVGLLANPARPRQVPEQVLDYFPMLKGMLTRKGGLLSGGQQQQLAIARALVANPRLLILDEPTEGIQPSIISLIGRVLEQLKREGNVSVLLVEQYFEFALKLADRYYVMEKGAMVLSGSAADLDKEAIKPYLAF